MSATTYQLRPYQQEACDAAWTFLHQHYGADRHGIICAPTGSGKSLIIAELVRRILEADPHAQILALTHVKELIEQNHAKLCALVPDAPCGIYSAGLGQRDTGSRVIFGGIQSVYQRTAEFGLVHVLIVDEVHLVPKAGDGMYRTAIDALREANPNLLIVGLTATPYRTDGGYLHEGEGALFTDIAYEVSIERMIDGGWLTRPTVKATRSEYTVQGVSKVGGDFAKGELERAIANQTETTQLAAEEIMERGKDRAAWLLFCCGVAHAEQMAETLREKGIEAACITGETPSDERAETLEKFKSGELRAITNHGVLTTGFDAPRTDLVALMRPTCSTVLYVQMVGRGLRLSPETGKTDALVLDFGGNVRRHGPINRVRVRKQSTDGEGVAPTKECPECESVVYAGFRECPDCGYEFPPTEREAQPAETEVEVYDTSPRIEELDVESVAYFPHEPRDGRTASMRVEYRIGAFANVSEWVCPQHEGFARTKFLRWWADRAATAPPETVAEAVARAKAELREPAVISVDYSEKFPRIKGYSAWRSNPLDGDEPPF